jgi:hypothetical protein
MSNSDVNAADFRHQRLPQVLAAIVLLAVLAWVAVGIWGNTRRAWAVLLTDFLFLTPLSAGLVLWPAIVLASRGKWMGSTQRTALAGIVLLPICVLILVVLIFGAHFWAPWLGRHLVNSWWLNAPFLFVRDIVSLLLFSGLAWWFVRAVKRGGQPKRLAAWLIFTYAIVFSILGIDLAMALMTPWPSVVYGIYYFISGLLAAAVTWLFISSTVDTHARPAQVHDQSSLVIAFSLLTTYLMFCQLLPIWYENMPDETVYLVPRMNWVTYWPAITIVLLASVYLGPLVLLMSPTARGNAAYTRWVSLYILAGLWLERWWLVMPSLHEPLAFGPSEFAGVAALVAGLLLFLVWLRRRVVPPWSGGPATVTESGTE